MKRHGWLLLALLLAGVWMTGCTRREANKVADAAVVRIGLVAPLTGPQAHLGKDNDNGARLALDEINAAGLTLGGKKVRLELISEDDQADPRTATIIAQKLVDNGVAGVIGHLNSGATIPASKVYHDAGIPQISPSATAIAYTAQGFDTTFRVMTNDEQQGKVLGGFAVSKLNATRIAIIDDRTAYGQGLADEFAKAAVAAGAQVVAREFTSDRSTDFMAILTSIKGKNPQLLFFGGMDAQGGPMAKPMKQLGLNAQLLGGDGLQTTEFIKLAGADAAGVLASSPGLALAAMPGGQAFREKFTARFGSMQIYAPYAYDAMQVMVAAMRRADSADPHKYLAALAGTDYQGVTGPVRFDAKGDVAGGSVTIYRVQNGAWQGLETVRSGQ